MSTGRYCVLLILFSCQIEGKIKLYAAIGLIHNHKCKAMRDTIPVGLYDASQNSQLDITT